MWGDPGRHLPAVRGAGQALRAVQCREGWHLETEPDLTPAAPDELQEFWLNSRGLVKRRTRESDEYELA